MLLRTHEQSAALRNQLAAAKHLTVIGAGFVGLEVAASAAQQGLRVTVLEAASRAMGRGVPDDVAEVLIKRHIAAGVDLRFGVVVERIEPTNRGVRVVLSQPQSTVEADLVVAGIGAVPNAELATDAGLTASNGIDVDQHLCTEDAHVFAAGDCCNAPMALYGNRRIRLEAWRNAHDQAVVAAENMLGGTAVYSAVPWFWSDQYELGLQVAGLPQLATQQVMRERLDGWAIRFGLDADGRLISAAGVAADSAIARDIRVAEMLIARSAHPDPAALADQSVALKTLL